MVDKSRNEHVETFLKGSFAGACSAVCLQPLDIVKTRQQGVQGWENASRQHTTSTRVSMKQAVEEIIERDGLRGLWRGLSPSLVRSSLGPGVYFLILHNLQGTKSSVFHHEERKAQVFFEGALARASAGTLLTPLAVVKTRFEWSRSQHEKSLIATLLDIARREKIRGLFRGVIPTLIRDVPSSGLYLVLYQSIFQPMTYRAAGDVASAPILNLSSALAAGALASLVTHPADALKTHVQLNNLNVLDGVVTLWRSRGIAGFFSGVTARMLRRPMSMGISWTVFEIVKDLERG